MSGYTRKTADIDDARLLPHLRARRPELVVSPDNGTTYVQTLQLGGKQARTAKAEPGDLRGIPVLAPGVGGTSPGTNPDSITRGKRGDWSPRKDQAA